MTIDDSPPSKEDVAYNKLSVDVSVETALSELYDDQFFSEAAHTDNSGTETVSRTALREQLTNILVRATENEAKETTAWDNGKHGMDPAHQGESVYQVLDEIELQEFADMKVEELMSQIESQTDSDGVLRCADLELHLQS